MSNDGHQQHIHEDFMQGLGVIYWFLVELEDKQFVWEVEQDEWDDWDRKKDRYDPTEGKSNEEGSDDIGIPLSDQKYLITVVL